MEVQAGQTNPSILDSVAGLAGHGRRGRLFEYRELFARYGRPFPAELEAVFQALPRPPATGERWSDRAGRGLFAAPAPQAFTL